MSFFWSALLCGPVDAVYDFEGITALVESGILLPFASGVHAFVSEVGLYSVLQGSQLEHGQGYLAYHRSFEVD